MDGRMGGWRKGNEGKEELTDRRAEGERHGGKNYGRKEGVERGEEREDRC